MSDSEVEKYETKIKDALLRRDSNLSTISSALKSIMSGSVDVNGKTMYLSDFGVETLGYLRHRTMRKMLITLQVIRMMPIPPVNRMC